VTTVVEFKHILCPIDFSDTSIRALTYAAAFATWYEAQLEVLHVVPAFEDGVASQEPPGRSDSRRPVSRLDIIAAIQRSLHEAGAGDLAPQMLAQEGRAHERIAHRAHAQPADLLVMGTHGRSGFNRLLLGSVTEKVLRTAHCPVLTVPPAAPAMTGPALTFKQILCAIDYSPSAIKALQYGLELGRQANGCVTVLNALEYLDPEEPCEHVDFDIRARRQHFIDHARARLHARLAQESATWCEVKETVAIDRAYKAILQHASASKADLIVMGAQGTAGLELMVYGSNTQHVVRAATCPVLTAHA
jgi:nucleotide-binding universal stress UspA family protein